MYKVVERSLGAYGWREFVQGELIQKWRDAVEEADRLAAYRRQAPKRVWSPSVVFVENDDGEKVYEVKVEE